MAAARSVVEALSHSYGRARRSMDVSFAVAPASFVALLGLNGAGKSTLFSLSRGFMRSAPAASAFSAMMSSANPARRCACSASCSSRARSTSISRSRRICTYHAALHGIGSARGARARRGGAGADRARRPRQRQGARSVRRPDAPRRDRPRAAAPAAAADPR